jgi:hypothetical protein
MNPKSSNSSDPKIVRILGAEQEMRGWKKLSWYSDWFVATLQCGIYTRDQYDATNWAGKGCDRMRTKGNTNMN